MKYLNKAIWLFFIPLFMLSTSWAQEIGTNDFRISFMGPNGDTAYQAFHHVAAYNSTANQYLIVWAGDDNTSPLVDDEQEIFGQLLDASGTAVGTRFRISDLGPNGNINYKAVEPAVAYNATNNEYLVVWSGDDDNGSLVDNEYEIYGQRLDASGNEIGTNDFRISTMGPDGDADYDANRPRVAWNSTNNEYLVAWDGDDNTSPLVNDEQEVFVQRLSNAGALLGSHIRISDAGPNGDTNFEAFDSDIVYNSTANEYLVVWTADDNSGALVDNEHETYGQRLDASGNEVGTNDFRISDMGPDGDTGYVAARPKVAYNSTTNEYLAIWDGDDNTAPLVNNEQEIFGQRLTAAGAEIGTNDFRISSVGPNGDTNYEALESNVVYNNVVHEYLVTWRSDSSAPLIDNEFEIHIQRLDASGNEIGINDIRISDAGPDGSTVFETLWPTVVFNSTANEYLILWYGDDDISPLVNNEYEIFGQRYVSASHFTNIAVSAGVDNAGGSGTSGVAWGDFDNDGNLDLYAAHISGSHSLYRNNSNNTFTDNSVPAGLSTATGNNISWGDIDNDNDLDLFITDGVSGQANSLYRNNGNGTFTDISSSAGVNDTGKGQGISWGDYDNDGDLDAFIANHSEPIILYRNNGNNTFTNVASSAGVNDSGTEMGGAWGDYDNDGDIDLYVTVNSGANILLQNNGFGSFVDVSISALVNDSGVGRGGSWGDYDRDGDLDLYVVNQGSANLLYQNTGNGTFTNVANATGVDDAGAGDAIDWLDYDNDGDLDISVSVIGPHLLYENDGSGNFTNVAATLGINIAGTTRYTTWGDFDTDGDLDLAISNETADPNYLYQNAGNTNTWLHVNTKGFISNKNGIGVQLTAVTGSTRQRLDANSAASFRNQPSLPLEFGFGNTFTIDSLIAIWPSGQTWDTTNVAANQILTIHEPLPQIVIPDTVANYASSINVPVRITDNGNLGIVAIELKIAYDNTIVTPGSPDKTEIVGTLVASGWSVEENVLPGSGNTDTLTVAMSTASDTINTDGTLIYLILNTSDIRHPASTALELTHVLLNDGSPASNQQNGSLTLIGTDGTIIASPDSINPANAVTVTITDADFDIDVGSADQVTATAVSKLYGDTETVTLTETGVNTGVFNGTLNTSFSLIADPSQNGTLGTIAGDSICVSYVDSLDSSGVTVTRQDTVEVIGGTDGIVAISYVVQALDGRNGVRDTVRVEIADADLDTDVGVAEQVSVTITNVISGEVEGVNLTETGVNTGIFQIRVPSVSGASGTNNNGELSLASWDTLNVTYSDALNAQGGSSARLDTTRVVNLFGDVRVNDNVQAFDAARLLAISVGLISSNTQTTLVGDVDGGGAIQAFDASLVLQYVVRLIDRFPIQIDFTDDPKNHPFEKPVPLNNVITLGNLNVQSDGTSLLPVNLSEREDILSGTLTLGIDAGVEIVDVDLASDYHSFMVAHNMTPDGLKVAFAGSQSELRGSGDVLMLKVRSTKGAPIRLSLDHVVLNGQTLTPSVNIEAMEEVINQTPELNTELYQNIPNPFNPQTTIKYAIAKAGQVQLVIYSVTGQRIRTLVSEFQDIGSYQLVWNGKDAMGKDVSSGIYLMRMQTSGFAKTQKMLLLK